MRGVLQPTADTQRGRVSSEVPPIATPATPSSRDVRTNKPLDLPTTPNRHKRWGKELPTMSQRQVTAIAAVREFESMKANAELPSRRNLMGGTSLLSLYRVGAAYAYPVHQWSQLSRWSTKSERARDQVPGRLGPREWLAIAWVLTAQLGYRRGGLSARYDELAELLGCSERTAGTVMRRLVKLRLLRRVPWHITDRYGNHERRANIYSVPPLVLELLGIGGQKPQTRGDGGAGSQRTAFLIALGLVDPDVGSSVVTGKNCQPTSDQRVTARTTRPDDRARTGGGAPGTPAGESIVTVPTAPAAQSVLQGVKARAAAHPRSSGGPEIGRGDPPQPLVRYQKPDELAKLEARLRDDWTERFGQALVSERADLAREREALVERGRALELWAIEHVERGVARELGRASMREIEHEDLVEAALPVLDILGPDEVVGLVVAESTPRPKRRDEDSELADAMERALRSWSEQRGVAVPVTAEVTIGKIRRGQS